MYEHCKHTTTSKTRVLVTVPSPYQGMCKGHCCPRYHDQGTDNTSDGVCLKKNTGSCTDTSRTEAQQAFHFTLMLQTFRGVRNTTSGGFASRIAISSKPWLLSQPQKPEAWQVPLVQPCAAVLKPNGIETYSRRCLTGGQDRWTLGSESKSSLKTQRCCAH